MSADLDLSLLISRDLLSLDALQLNDFVNYYVAAQFLGQSVAWNKQQVTSPWTDGSVTTNRQRQTTSQPIAIEVLGDTLADMVDNANAMVQAFLQDSYTLDLIINGVEWKYQAEAADVQPSMVGSRFVANQLQFVFNVPIQPVPLIGSF